MSHLKDFWKFFWPDNASNVTAVFIASLAALMGLLDYLEAKKLASLTLGALALVAFSLIRDRYSRDKLTTAMQDMLGEKAPLPAQHFFKNQTEERTILDSANKSADLIQETGSLVTERCQDQIIRILSGGGRVRIIVCMPENRAAKALAHRNENLEHAGAIINRLDNFHNQIKFLSKSAGPSSAHLEVRYTPYDPGYTLVLTNSETNFANKMGLVRLAGFRVPFNRKLDFSFDSKTSPALVDSFADEFKKLFLSCSKFVLLTAEPRYGKTTIFKELLLIPGLSEFCYHVISIRSEDGLSFLVYSSTSPQPQEFAVRNTSANFQDNDIRNYDIKHEVWDLIADEIAEALKQRKVIVIDEIGQMQLKSHKFASTVTNLLQSSESSVFATIGLENDISGEIKAIKEDPRSTVLIGDKDNMLQIKSALRDELEGSIRLRKFMV